MDDHYKGLVEQETRALPTLEADANPAGGNHVQAAHHGEPMSLEALIQSEELHRYKTALEKIVSVNVHPKVEVGSYLQTIARDALNRRA